MTFLRARFTSSIRLPVRFSAILSLERATRFHADGFFYVSGGGHVWRYDSATGAFHDTFATGISGAAGIAFVEVVPEPFTITAFAFALPLFWRRRRQR